MDMNKNTIILILIVSTLIGSIWGAVSNSKKNDMERKLNETVANMKQLAAATAQEQEQVLEKTAALQENLLIKDQQIGKARKELVALRRENQGLEARLSDCNAKVMEATAGKEQCLRDLAAARRLVSAPSGAAGEAVPGENNETADSGIESILDQPREAVLTGGPQEQLEPANARIAGLEKIIVEKTEAAEEAGKQMERLRINNDVLLTRIAEQREMLRELEEKNHALNLELAARNEELAELRGGPAKQPDAERQAD